ncbi:unnamed protein product [Amoebophrya sp. A120]|nr:unnamed protein product [Amoebophrya sp. A120]|eukprot:GSA120T00019796001.1
MKAIPWPEKDRKTGLRDPSLYLHPEVDPDETKKFLQRSCLSYHPDKWQQDLRKARASLQAVAATNPTEAEKDQKFLDDIQERFNRITQLLTEALRIAQERGTTDPACDRASGTKAQRGGGFRSAGGSKPRNENENAGGASSKRRRNF